MKAFRSQYRLMMLEVGRALSSPFFLTTVVIGITLASIDGFLYASAAGEATRAFELHGSQKDCGLSAVSCYIGWIGAGHGAFARLYFTLLPLLVLLPYSSSRISDERSGLLAQVSLRAGRAAAEKSKMAATFMASGVSAAAPLICSIMLMAALVPGRTPQMRDLVTLQSGVTTDVIGHNLFYTHPFLFVLLWVAIIFVLAGLWGTSVMAITRCCHNRVLVTVGAYLFQMLLAYLTGDFAEAFGGVRAPVDLFVLMYPVGDGAVARPWALMVSLAAMAVVSATLVVGAPRRDYL